MATMVNSSAASVIGLILGRKTRSYHSAPFLPIRMRRRTPSAAPPSV